MSAAARRPHGKLGVSSFYIAHPRPCPDPRCQVTSPLLMMCLTISLDGKFHSHIHTAGECGRLEQHLQHKTKVMIGLRVNAVEN